MSYLTIEEVADRLNMTVTQVRESRRKGEWPGNVGKRQGRRLRFNADLIESGPQEPTTTSDPVDALLWTAQGIEAKLAEILKELRAQRPTYFTTELIESITETTIEIGEEE